MTESDTGQDGLQTPLDALGIMASQQGLLSPTIRQVEMYTRRGLLSLLWHEPSELTRNVGIVMMGGAMGNQMAGMMNQMGQNMNQQQNTPPPLPTISYSVSVNGQTAGPFNMQQLQQMVQNGQLSQNTHVWKQGMAKWEIAGNIQELTNLFGTVPPPPVL